MRMARVGSQFHMFDSVSAVNVSKQHLGIFFKKKQKPFRRQRVYCLHIDIGLIFINECF